MQVLLYLVVFYLIHIPWNRLITQYLIHYLFIVQFVGLNTVHSCPNDGFTSLDSGLKRVNILNCAETRYLTFCANSETVELVYVEDLGITKFLGLKFDSDLIGKKLFDVYALL